MTPFTVNPLYIEVGLPALGIGLLLGATIAWLVARQRQRHLVDDIERLNADLKSQDAVQLERESAFEAATSRLAKSFADLSNQSLKSNSETFLRLAQQNLNAQSEKAKHTLSEQEKAVENLVKPIHEALKASQKQITDLEMREARLMAVSRNNLKRCKSARSRWRRKHGISSRPCGGRRCAADGAR